MTSTWSQEGKRCLCACACAYACARARVCVCVRGGAGRGGGRRGDLQVRVDEAFGRGEMVEQPARRADLRVQDASPQAMARAGRGPTRASQGPHGRLRGGVWLLSAGPAASQRRPSRRAVLPPGSRLGHAAWAMAWAVARSGRWRGRWPAWAVARPGGGLQRAGRTSSATPLASLSASARRLAPPMTRPCVCR